MYKQRTLKQNGGNRKKTVSSFAYKSKKDQ